MEKKRIFIVKKSGLWYDKRTEKIRKVATA